MRIHHLNCGSLCPISASFVNGAGGWFRRGHLVCHCLLIETKDGLILVDTGVGALDLADAKRRLGRLFTLVAHPDGAQENTALMHVLELGFAPHDVRHIVPTHLDLDHAGGLPDFPAAAVHVYAPELAAATKPRFADRTRYRAVHFGHQPRWVVHETAGEKWFGFDGVRAVSTDAEVLLVPLPGHSRGHCGVAVRTDEGWLLHAGDAYFDHREMDPAGAHCPPGLALFQRLTAFDDPTRRRNQLRLRELAERESSVRIHCAHSPEELAREVEHGRAQTAPAPALTTRP